MQRSFEIFIENRGSAYVVTHADEFRSCLESSFASDLARSFCELCALDPVDGVTLFVEVDKDSEGRNSRTVSEGRAPTEMEDRHSVASLLKLPGFS